jgi:hypothetical protein
MRFRVPDPRTLRAVESIFENSIEIIPSTHPRLDPLQRNNSKTSDLLSEFTILCGSAFIHRVALPRVSRHSSRNGRCNDLLLFVRVGEHFRNLAIFIPADDFAGR